ncbi:MAG: transketolase C-terminal domain-containing protein [Clostridia bacterium]|nr:transketolase C-terminal domain-containing protein [Clostridia bacterium]
MNKAQNPREIYGKTLLALARENRNIVALDADLSKSTMSVYIENELPAQYVECGIAEQNMLGTAAGLALTGKIPFANTFAVFIAGRAYDQIRQSVSIAKLNVKIVGSCAGLSDFSDGATHQMVEDIAIMRVIPNMTVICPSDANQVEAATREIARYHGPVYMRIGRGDMCDISEKGADFEIGKTYLKREGTQLTVFSCGIMTAMALEAAEQLEGEQISVRVVDVPTVKPIDRESIVSFCRDTKKVLCAEEHSIIGGLGSAVVEALRMERVETDFLGIRDEFGQSSNDLDALRQRYGLTVEEIKRKIREMIAS